MTRGNTTSKRYRRQAIGPEQYFGKSSGTGELEDPVMMRDKIGIVPRLQISRAAADSERKIYRRNS